MVKVVKLTTASTSVHMRFHDQAVVKVTCTSSAFFGFGHELTVA